MFSSINEPQPHQYNNPLIAHLEMPLPLVGPSPPLLEAPLPLAPGA